ncbi:unnamed protein product [Macrosiphum euphorbiae]|uniref:RING-type domain-containing protein n=1 Tax=Macrosiphum euphorbiae TaxID=13131 RepID=A0AAV0Y4K0_9HEMI|nr:unnamed protein product [Macrosiphum euphorbiae]
MNPEFSYKYNGGEKKGIRYLVCREQYCKGTAKRLANGIIVNQIPHTHEPNNLETERLESKKEFRSKLIQRAVEETTKLRIIYDEECLRYYNILCLELNSGVLLNTFMDMLELLEHYCWPTAETSMRKALKKIIPPLGTTYTGCIKRWLIKAVKKCMLMQLLRLYHLMIMHIIIQNHSIPVRYVLMESKTETAYTQVLMKCKVLFPEIKPICIMTDFEIALQNAFKIVYPDAIQHACFFHYVQCLVKNIRSQGLIPYVKNNEMAQICIKMIAALALLPSNKIEEGFQIIRRYSRDSNINLTSFFTYFSNYSIQTRGPEVFSVHGIPRRTSNNIESFHSQLKEKFQTVHPNLWTFLEHLNNLSKKNHIIIQQLERGQRVTRPIKMKYLANSERIMTATRQLTLGIITVKEFLLQCSHSTETYLRQEINWHNNIEQDENMQASDQEDENMQANDLQDDENMQANVHQDDENQQDNDNNESDVIVYDQIEPLQHVINVIENDSNSDDSVYFPFLRPGVRRIERNDSDESVANDGINQPLNNENGSPSHQEIHWNEEDFIIPEELDPDIIYMMEIKENRRIWKCKIYLTSKSNTHALSPCGHKSLCLMCLESLVSERCPICNSIFTSNLRIW